MMSSYKLFRAHCIHWKVIWLSYLGKKMAFTVMNTFIYYHLMKCRNKLKVYMMTCGLKQAKATSAIADFKKWMKACME